MSDVVPTKPGTYWYWPGIPGAEAERVELRDTGECGLGIFFKDRQDYDLVSEVSGRFEPIQVR